MAYAEIPTAQEFKKACGRTGPRSLFKKKKDLDPVVAALALAEPFRKSVAWAAIAPLRNVRKACCAWIASNEGVTRVSRPKVRDLCGVVHKTINDIVERTYGGRKLGLPEKPTLKNVAQRVMDVKGTAGPVGRTLEESYWIEKILPNHLGKGAWSAAFSEWRQEKTKTRLNIADWLTYVYAPECEDDPFGKYIANRIQRMGLRIQAGKGVRYCDAEERKSYAIQIALGNATDAGGETYDTTEESTVFSGKGWAIFVMAPDDTVYAHSHVADEFHHSSFLAGAPIKCGGEIRIEQGAIKEITPKTGHYRAGAAELKQFLLFCQQNGVRLRDVQVCPNPFGEAKNKFAGDAVLLADGKEPTPEQIARAEAAGQMPQRPTRPVPQPPGKQGGGAAGVKDLIHKWENIGKR